ncbi:hypothetical protein [Lyngbya aestuarii]|uniref:hypothetical protein n=1 Tax=Lyngbya aestuarii TaxID=118322 RepID=UPI00403D6894
MTTVEGNILRATEAGYEFFYHFILPQNAWWDEYLHPLKERVAMLRRQSRSTSAMVQVIEETEREIDICDRYGESFGYVFYLMRKI